MSDVTNSQPTHASDLDRLSEQWAQIAETPECPRTTMDVIEYGLGKQRRAEVYVNRLLCYLLDPENPHGMGDDFLRAFLDTLPESVGFAEDTFDLSNVRVNQQVTVEEEDSTGYADLVLDVPREWFLLIELKFSAAETGTEFYAEASRLGSERFEGYESGRYYLYLHQHDEPAAGSCAFHNWTWRAFLGDVLDEIIRENAPRYPQRTATQLHELRDDLRTITSMTDERHSQREQIELYLEHADAIEAVRSAFDEAWESYSERWDERLATVLAESGKIDRIGGDEVSEVTVPRTDSSDESWYLRATGGDWQHFHRDGWYRREDTLESLPTRADDRNDLRIGFYFRMDKHRAEAVQDQQLQFNFRNMGSNPSEFTDIYDEQFEAKIEPIRQHVADTEGTLTGNKRTKITATYDIPVASHDRFFEAYTAALHEAFVDFVVESPALICVLTEAFEAAVEEFGSSSDTEVE